MAGFAVLTAGGYLGGYLSFVLGVNVNHTAWEYGPDDWTAVAAETDLPDGHTRRVEAGGAGILLHRDDATIHAISSVCSHAGGPLEQGTVAEGCVTCPWHGSIFRLADGHVDRGPASVPQPAYDTRITGGQIEIRARG
jgi:nitrite reductase/ring-hydroxylating ferredoxin subunit